MSVALNRLVNNHGSSATVAIQALKTRPSSKMHIMLKIRDRSVIEVARKPSLDVLKRARDQRRNWLGHILRMEEHRLVRRVLLLCVKPTPESIFGDVPDLNVAEAITLSKRKDRVEKVVDI